MYNCNIFKLYFFSYHYFWVVGGLRIGVTSHAKHPAGCEASSLPLSDTWLLCDRDVAEGEGDHVLKLKPGDKAYGFGSLSYLDEVRIVRDGPRLSFLLNGIPQGEAFNTLPSKVYLCAALNGRCTSIKIVSQGPL